MADIRISEQPYGVWQLGEQEVPEHYRMMP
jgi:hypothetical protein